MHVIYVGLNTSFFFNIKLPGETLLHTHIPR